MHDDAHISLQEVMIVIITPTTVTSCNLLGRLAALIIHVTRRVYKSSFENLEDELNTDRGNKMKKANIRIRKLYLNIRMEGKYSNIRIFVDILTQNETRNYSCKAHSHFYVTYKLHHEKIFFEQPHE